MDRITAKFFPEPSRLKNAWTVLEQSQPAKNYPKGRMIYLQGDLADSFFYLKNGRVKIFLSSENGMEKTLTVLEKGNIFGEAAFFDGMPRVSSAKTLTKSEIVAVTRSSLLKSFSKAPELAMALLEYLAQTIRMLSAQVDGMAFLPADKRIARLLLQISSETPGNPIPCTHEDLGNLAGVSRVTVSRVLNCFQKNGWIQTRYKAVFIQDTDALGHFASS